jgi:hypothetical protein
VLDNRFTFGIQPMHRHSNAPGPSSLATTFAKDMKSRAPGKLKQGLERNLPGLRQFNLKEIGIDQERFFNDIGSTREISGSEGTAR